MPRNTFRLLAGFAALAAVPVFAAATPAQAGDQIDDPGYDFDCDDKRDAVDANSFAFVDGKRAAGSVRVRYSTDDRIHTIDQSTPGIAGTPETGDQFGGATTFFDENGDGCDDLIVSADAEGLADKNGVNRVAAGMVWIIPGSPSGLDTAKSRSMHLDSPGVPGAVADYQRFGMDVAAGSTSGKPFLVIGSSALKDERGAVYYLRGGTIHRITQDTPGVAGSTEAGDWFGSSIAVSDRYIAVGSWGETIAGRSGAGMTHVFSHKLTDGHLTPIGAFHQDTPGITGAAETEDRFGGGLSVISYRAAPGGPVMPLVSVGSYGEALGGTDDYNVGMAHLVAIPAPGQYRQLASVHKNTPGVAGETHSEDYFGKDTVLTIRDTSSVGTPATTSWAVTSRELDTSIPEPAHSPQAHIFGVTATPGTDSTVVARGDFGLPLDSETDIESLNASRDYLYLGLTSYPPGVYGVPWGNILSGENEPIVIHRVGE